MKDILKLKSMLSGAGPAFQVECCDPGIISGYAGATYNRAAFLWQACEIVGRNAFLGTRLRGRSRQPQGPRRRMPATRVLPSMLTCLDSHACAYDVSTTMRVSARQPPARLDSHPHLNSHVFRLPFRPKILLASTVLRNDQQSCGCGFRPSRLDGRCTQLVAVGSFACRRDCPSSLCSAAFRSACPRARSPSFIQAETGTTATPRHHMPRCKVWCMCRLVLALTAP